MWTQRDNIDYLICYLIYFSLMSNDKGLSSQSFGFSSSHVWMWELDYKESWILKNWCFSTIMLEKTPESPLDCKEIKPVSPKGNQSWIFIGMADAEAEVDGVTDWMDLSLSKLGELVIDREAWHAVQGRKELDMIERLNWTKWVLKFIKLRYIWCLDINQLS